MQRNTVTNKVVTHHQQSVIANSEDSLNSAASHHIIPNRSVFRAVERFEDNTTVLTTRTNSSSITSSSSTTTNGLRRTDAAGNADLMATYFQRQIIPENGNSYTVRTTTFTTNTNTNKNVETSTVVTQENTADPANPVARNRSILGLTKGIFPSAAKATTSSEPVPRVAKIAPSPKSSLLSRLGLKSSSGPTKSFAQQCLQHHNELRARHSAPALVLDTTIMKVAQKWAEVLASTNRMEHSPDRRYGENIYCCSGFEPTGQQVVRAWYDEISAYDFERAQFTPGTGHFTAVVWCETRKMGMGFARSSSGQFFVVANYDPPGNMMGSFQQNVLRPALTAAKLPAAIGMDNAVQVPLQS